MDETEIGPLERSWGAALKASATESCPTAEKLVDFIELGPTAACHGEVVQHLSRCPECRRLILDLRALEKERSIALKKAKPWPFSLLNPDRPRTGKGNL